MLLDRIQAHLEAIYGVRCELKASDHLVDAAGARALGGHGDREELFVREAGDALELALYVRADADGFAGFCEATEGVSHFMYLVRAAELDRQVSLLELEAQAEVDKFASCALLGWRHGDVRSLYERLFDRVQFRDDLAPDARWRYEQANRLAKGYCRRLLELVVERRLEPLLAELRETYRMGSEAKLLRLGA
ncbi:MAG: hypothetical protein JNK82_27965 [Myxococcaceae bacterium]|nr:hypothetical protein [Myxococcaceae bacterium]